MKKLFIIIWANKKKKMKTSFPSVGEGELKPKFKDAHNLVKTINVKVVVYHSF